MTQQHRQHVPAQPFSCAECGRERRDETDRERAVGLCLACIIYPAWFRSHHFGVPHDGRELVERRMPHLAMVR